MTLLEAKNQAAAANGDGKSFDGLLAALINLATQSGREVVEGDFTCKVFEILINDAMRRYASGKLEAHDEWLKRLE